MLDVPRAGTLLGTLGDNIERLKSAVELLDSTGERYFYSCVDKVKPAVHHYANVNHFTYTTPHPCIFHYLRKEDAVKLEIPKRDDVILKPLSEENAVTVNEIWPHRDKNSMPFVKRLINTDFTIGAFDKETGELMAWCLRLPIGSLGLLQVKEKYFRQGLGRLVTIAQAKQLAENGQDSSATILFENTASRTLFRSLGFFEWGERSWMFQEGLGSGHYD
ncbi:GLYATL3.2 family protein [Megaselia abdita]